MVGPNSTIFRVLREQAKVYAATTGVPVVFDLLELVRVRVCVCVWGGGYIHDYVGSEGVARNSSTADASLPRSVKSSGQRGPIRRVLHTVSVGRRKQERKLRPGTHGNQFCDCTRKNVSPSHVTPTLP